MKKTAETNPNYSLRRAVVVGGAIAGLAITTGAAKEYVVDPASHRIGKEHATVQIPPASGEFKTFNLGDDFEVDGKRVTIGSLSQASILANLPGVDSRATLEMLKSELPTDVSVTEITDATTFRLPVDSQIGHLHTGE